MSDLFGPIGRRCCACRKVFMSASDFYPERRKKSGLGSKCRECQKAYGRAYTAKHPAKNAATRKAYAIKTRDVSIERSRDFYYSKPGKSKVLINGIKARSAQKGWETDLDADFILKLLESDVCVVTGIPFVYDRPVRTTKNPFAPSIDRIDSSLPYLRSNVRIVIWQYNLMKGELSDDELLQICEKVLDVRRKA